LNLDDICVNENKSIKEAMKIIDKGGLRLAFVTGKDKKLVGVVSDGDIRKHILNGISLEVDIEKIMNPSPIFVKKEWDKEKISETFTKEEVRNRIPQHGSIGIPVLDKDNHVVDLMFLSEEESECKTKFELKIEGREKKVKPVKKVLVVGGAGYLGSVLCRKLLEKGHFVRVLDNLTYGDEGIKALYQHSKFEFIKGDMRDIQTVVDAVKNIDAVVHLAALVGDPASALDPEETIEINYLGTKMLAEVCKYGQINRFLFASTCSVYGANPEPDVRIKEGSQLNPVSLYAEMKLKSEQGLLEITDENFSPTILRMATLYGLSPRMRFDLVVNTLTIKALKENKFSIFGGEQWRPNLHVSDAADAYIKCLEAPIDEVRAEIFNVGSNNENYKIIEIGQTINSLIPETQMIIDKKNVDRRDYNVSFDKIVGTLSFTTEHSIQEGVKEIKEAVESGMFNDYSDNKYSNYLYLKGE
jgi:nucleoside-diphosphate-sugar epimerase/CBS domain-containing protein